MRTTTQPEDKNVVRLSVEVDEPEVDEVIDEAVRTLTRQARVPGFRPGKVPRRVLEARMGGAGAVRAEALREALPDFYARAVAEAEVDPIAPPDIDITAGEDAGALAFDAVVQVRPQVSVAGYDGLRVTVPALEVTDEEVDRQVDRLRENEGELVDVSRPAVDGDHVTIDLHLAGDGQEGTDTHDFLYEVGSGTVLPELDERLRGASAGDILAFSTTVAEGRTLSGRVLVKGVQEKHLPEATDEWAAENSEFDTVDGLRQDLRERMGRVKVVQAQLALREATTDELVALVDDDEVPGVLVDEEIQERARDLEERLAERHIAPAEFLAATGRSGDDLLEEFRHQAHRAVKVDLALRAVADAVGIEVSPEDLDAEIATMAERLDVAPPELRRRLDRAGRTAAVRSELRKQRAMSWLLEHVETVDEEGRPVPREALSVDQGVEGDDGVEDTTDGGEGEEEQA